MNPTFVNAVRRIVELLVNGDYVEIARMTRDQRLDSDAIRRAVEDYGRKLTLPPAQAFKQLDIVEVKSASPARWSVRMNLWTVEEGRSDLSLELTLIASDSDYAAELDNIHVL